ncbi:MAG: YhbY family RNA-binding protein [Gammaproteobacteria bacterium]|nr:YhbY family RNA-binding protein [Gammaproteobacteria bacterium]
MKLNNKQIKFLRGKGQEMKPVVWLGQAGCSPAVLSELDQALEHHELVKVKIAAGDRVVRDQLVAQMCTASGAALVQRIGNVALLYRPAAELPRLLLPA